MSVEKNQKLGIWLIIIGIGAGLSVLSQTIVLATLLIFSYLEWDTLIITKEFEVVLALFIGEIVANSLLLFGTVVAFLRFLKKKKNFPSLYILLLFLSAVLIPVDSYIASFIIPEKEFFDTKILIRTLVSTLWLALIAPYLVESNKAKAIYVN